MARADVGLIMEDGDTVDVRFSEWPQGSGTTHIYFGEGSCYCLRVRGKAALIRLIAALTSADMELNRQGKEAEEFAAEVAN